nr:hypothetical protein [uncultured Caproiciproducens sp.]
MKKIGALICAFTMVFALAACKGQAAPTNVSGVTSQTASDGGVTSGAGSGTVSSGTASSGTAVSSKVTTPSQAPKVENPKAISGENNGTYTVKDEKYTYKNGNMTYSASYPVLSGKVTGADKANTAIKASALKTINSLGTGAKTEKTTVKVNSDVTYEGKSFISIGFNEYVKLSAKAENVHTLRAVNINLKTGTALEMKDLIVKNDALYKLLETAAKQQLSSDIAPSVTAGVIKSALDSGAVYFTKYDVGFAFQITKPENRLVKLSLTYAQIKPYATSNEIWKNFI